MRLIGSPGQPNDIAFAHDLVQGFEAEATTADKGYDADHFHETIAETGAQIVISPKRNRKIQSPYDRDLYKERHLIERFFAKLKQFRHVATRYDKVLINFMGFVKLAAMAIWLKQLKVTTPRERADGKSNCLHRPYGRDGGRRYAWPPDHGGALGYTRCHHNFRGSLL